MTFPFDGESEFGAQLCWWSVDIRDVVLQGRVFKESSPSSKIGAYGARN
jgi:hypothetical protein